MTTHVSFETAKLLKKKGFDNQCLNFYTNPKCKMFGIDEHDRYYPIKNKTKTLWVSGDAATLDSKHVYYAPTIAETVMWLYEKHRIWVNVYLYKDHAADVNDDYMFRSNYTKIREYKTPTEAYKVAIEYVLTNLIK